MTKKEKLEKLERFYKEHHYRNYSALARDLGISRSTIANYRSGYREITNQTLRMMDVLDENFKQYLKK